MTDQPSYLAPIIDSLINQLPDCDPHLIDLYALLAATRGESTTMSDVHDAWAIWRHATRPDHPSIVPFEKLDQAVQELDRPYMEAIHRAAVEVH